MKAKNIILVFVIFILFPFFTYAKFWASGVGITYEQGYSPFFQGLDTIIIFEKIVQNNNPQIHYNHSNQDTYDYSWYKVTASGEQLISNADQNKIETSIALSDNGLGEGTYRVRIQDILTDTSVYLAVINYDNHKVNISEVVIHDDGETPNNNYNRCKTAYLEAKYTQNNIMVYDPKLGVEQELKPYQKIFDWTWGTGTQKRVYESITSVAASFDDVNYAVKISDNFFYNDDNTIGEATANKDYEAIAVTLQGIKATIERDIDNEADHGEPESDPLVGSAPLDVSFEAKEPSSKVIYQEWKVWRGTDSARVTLSNNSSFRYTFTTPLENPESNAADYTLTLKVSNEFCDSSAVKLIKLKESHLAIANLFVIGFGATLEYKADYRSLRPGTFRGYIYSRNGRRVFQWTDPSKGWDGRIGGTGGFVQPGMYVVVLRAKGTDGIDYKIRHSLTIVREK